MGIKSTYSRHMGGVWERMIRTTRQVLKATLKEQLVTDEVLSTAMAEVVNIINSRPLSRNSDSHLDEQPLTPNDFFFTFAPRFEFTTGYL